MTGYVYCHYDGPAQLSARAIKTLMQFNKFFRTTTAREYSQMGVQRQLTKVKKKLYEGLPDGCYRFVIRQSCDLGEIMVFNGRRSSVNWARSVERGQLVFENLTPATFELLYPELAAMVRRP